MAGAGREWALVLVVCSAAVVAGCSGAPFGPADPVRDSPTTRQLPDVTVRYVADESRVAAAPEHATANYSDLTDAQQAEFTRALNGSTTAGPLAYTNYEYVRYDGQWYRILLIEY